MVKTVIDVAMKRRRMRRKDGEPSDSNGRYAYPMNLYIPQDRLAITSGYRQGAVVTFPVECYETCFESENEAKEKGLRFPVTPCNCW